MERFEVQFQSAPPVKGGDSSCKCENHVPKVSIRAPREGGRLIAAFLPTISALFQSAPPVKGGDRGSLESFPVQGKKRVFREPSNFDAREK